MHATWKAWLHCGSTRIWSPVANSDKQIAHSEENLEAESAVKVSVGRDFRIFFFNPLLAKEGDGGTKVAMAAACGDGGGGDGVVVVVVEERRRSQAQRATATRPNTQIRAHRRAARITTKSESTVTGSTGSDDDVTSLRSLRGRVM